MAKTKEFVIEGTDDDHPLWDDIDGEVDDEWLRMVTEGDLPTLEEAERNNWWLPS